jgi:ABC-type glycerol-3-phosphate transport system substrate-binding protein
MRMTGDNTPAPSSTGGGGGSSSNNNTIGTTGAWRFLEYVSSSEATLVLQHRRAGGAWVTVHAYQDATA